eukprot:TRINITY_DN5609_c0_g1_i14.p1 TRINITY_DN5609_c0_g1~~TRINITY_DN5609_c0_g1_i14.p1  ORF type:complete len:445 (-),score=210.56 TRINITY_DN5609_c0_g1_i14:1480-2814(-)
MALNVNRNVQDAFYRYKMPRLQAKVEGKGNGIKTVLVNMVDVARALCRPPTYVTKYFGCELGAQTNADVKNERYIVNGCHEAGKLQDMLDGFIKKFVLCEKCENPETVLKVKKNMIGASCKACGHVFTLDMRHKLTAFILKHPPEKEIEAQGESVTKKKDRKDKNGKKEGGSDEGEDDNANDDWGEDEVDWGEDTSDDAVRKRMEALSGGLGGLVIDNDLDKPEVERINIFHQYVKKKIQAGPMTSVTQKEILGEAERLEVKNKAPIVLCELLFDEKMFKEKQISKHKNLFLRFTHDNPKAQKYLMGGIEKTIESQDSALLPRVPHILKEFFEADILEEEVILEWAKKVSKKYVSKDMAQKIHEKAAPFITWLKEAEEESEESSDEDGIELEFDERAKISKIKETSAEPEKENTTANGVGAAAGGANAAENGDDEEDDIDIDDI